MLLKCGNYYSLPAHLEYIQKHFKDETGLLDTDIRVRDKQDCLPVVRICSPNVISCLKKNHSEFHDVTFTVVLLEYLYQLHEAILVDDIHPNEKIGKIWEVYSFFRMWHAHIKTTPNLSINVNFFSWQFFSDLCVYACSIPLTVLTRYQKKALWNAPYVSRKPGSDDLEKTFGQIRVMVGGKYHVTVAEFARLIERGENLKEWIAKTDIERFVKYL